MKKNFNAILIGNGTMGGRHRAFFESAGVQFKKCFDMMDVGGDGNLRAGVLGETLLSNSIDFAVVASPAGTHYRYVKECLERKVSVFVEKPLATSGCEAQELVELAAKNNVVLFVAQSECFNPIFLNFRKHFLCELKAYLKALEAEGEHLVGVPQGPVHVEFCRKHPYSARCRDVNVALDILVHDLSLCLSMFRFEDLNVSNFTVSEDGDKARMSMLVAKGEFAGVSLEFVVDRNSMDDVRTISVDFAKAGKLSSSSYSVSLAHYHADGNIVHSPDSLVNEHKFFLKLMGGACADWGRRAAQNAADAVKLIVK